MPRRRAHDINPFQRPAQDEALDNWQPAQHAEGEAIGECRSFSCRTAVPVDHLGGSAASKHHALFRMQCRFAQRQARAKRLQGAWEKEA
eukprot:1140640-Pelagomonas_calceolata.AAC.7